MENDNLPDEITYIFQKYHLESTDGDAIYRAASGDTLTVRYRDNMVAFTKHSSKKPKTSDSPEQPAPSFEEKDIVGKLVNGKLQKTSLEVKSEVFMVVAAIAIIGGLVYWFMSPSPKAPDVQPSAKVETTAEPQPEAKPVEETAPAAKTEEPAVLPSKLIGANKAQVQKMMEKAGFHSAKAHFSYDLAFAKTNKVEVHVIFSDDGIATGADVFSLNPSPQTGGADSYVNKHIEELLQLIAGSDRDLPIKNNVNHKDRKYPSELYVGNDRNDE